MSCVNSDHVVMKIVFQEQLLDQIPMIFIIFKQTLIFVFGALNEYMLVNVLKILTGKLVFGCFETKAKSIQILST